MEHPFLSTAERGGRSDRRVGGTVSKIPGGDRFFMHHGSVSSSLRTEPNRNCGTARRAHNRGGHRYPGDGHQHRQAGPGNLRLCTAPGPFGPASGKTGNLFQPPGREGFLEEPVNGLPWDLLKTIELYLGEKWIEQGDKTPCPTSLLVHQTISVLCSLGPTVPAPFSGGSLPCRPFLGLAKAKQGKSPPSCHVSRY